MKSAEDRRSFLPHQIRLLDPTSTMLTYTTLKLGPSDGKTAGVSDPAAALALVKGVDWATIMVAWLETQEAPLPAVIFCSPDRRARLHVSTIPLSLPGSSCQQVMLMWKEKTGWFQSRRHVLSAEVHDHALLTRCLADLAAGEIEALIQLLRAEGVSVLD
ncbi:hypothetical protein [Variovorax boronicumulans]|uniref:hypothetical protein n=1 Tax=Variovorax boronicumulans TaxID=436515 RepID=UPI001C596371